MQIFPKSLTTLTGLTTLESLVSISMQFLKFPLNLMDYFAACTFRKSILQLFVLMRVQVGNRIFKKCLWWDEIQFQSYFKRRSREEAWVLQITCFICQTGSEKPAKTLDDTCFSLRNFHVRFTRQPQKPASLGRTAYVVDAYKSHDTLRCCCRLGPCIRTTCNAQTKLTNAQGWHLPHHHEALGIAF